MSHLDNVVAELHRERVANIEALQGLNGSAAEYAVTWDKSGRTPKLVLPEPPINKEPAKLCAWLTVVFHRHPGAPITGGVWQGLRGPDGHVMLTRASGAPAIRFEPVTNVDTPAKLISTLSWNRIKGDGPPYPYTTSHCREIAHVIGSLCDSTEAETAEQQAAAIVGTFLQSAHAVTGRTTKGTPGQRFEAAIALRRDIDDVTGRPTGPPRYLIDGDELVIAVSELAFAARHHMQTSLPRGWLDARMDGLGWTRVRLDGHELPGRSGNRSPHARVDAYRGQLPGVENEPGEAK
jgi:hypothetical protein